MVELISSTKNPKIKNIIHLKKSGERKKQNTILIEGEKEIEKALAAEIKFQSIFICQKIAAKSLVKELQSKVDRKSIFYITEEVFDHFAYRKGSGGVFALGVPKFYELTDLSPAKNPLIVVLEAVEKPGNLGAILRTADAAGVEGIIVCDSQTDIFNPNVIRSSLGCIFTNKVVTTDSSSAAKWLKDNNIKCFGTYLNTPAFYHQQDYSSGSAIIMGTEATGLSDFWKLNADVLIRIPMQGSVDSMNVSVSAAIILFEALRQRGFTNQMSKSG